ncbi:MAG: FHA domain-containing protein [Planctomycetota bacterium]
MTQPTVILELLTTEAAGTQYRIAGASAIIGRSADCDVPLGEIKGLSRRHSELAITAEGVSIKDLGSANGTQVNGHKVEHVLLESGCTVRMGGAEFNVLIDDGVVQAPVLTAGGAAEGAVAPGAEGMAPAAPGAGPSYGSELIPEDSGEFAALEPTNQRRRFILTSLSFLLFVGVILYGVSSFVAETTDPRVEHYVIAGREQRVIFVGRTFDGQRIVGERGRVLDARNGPVKVGPYRGLFGKRKETERFLVIEGRQSCRVEIQPLLKGAAVGSPFIVHVRGVLPSPFDEYMDPSEALRRAELRVKEAQILTKDQSYDALKRLREASRYFEMANAIDRKSEIEAEIDTIRIGLGEKLRRLLGDAFESMIERKGRARDPNLTVQLCEEIKQLVPDEMSLEWQLANELQILARGHIR